MKRYQLFLAAMLGLDALGLGLGSLYSSPDAFAQLVFVGPLLVAAPAVAYWVAYRDGLERLGVTGADGSERREPASQESESHESRSRNDGTRK